MFPMKYQEVNTDNLSKAGWSCGCVSAIDSKGRTILIADAHRGDEKRFLEKERERHCDHVRTARAPMKRATLPPKGSPFP